MHSLSWLIYLIGLIGSLKLALAIATFAGIILIICAVVAYVIATGILIFEPDTSVNDIHAARYVKSISKKVSMLCIAVFVLNVITPSSDTVKLIAATEVTSYLVQTDAGQHLINTTMKEAGKTGEIVDDSLQLLHKYIKDQLKTETKVDTKNTNE